MRSEDADIDRSLIGGGDASPVEASMPGAEAVEGFRRTVRTHQQENSRRMAWRETRDPWAILVSEVMLQQTQVSRVQVKFEEWFDAFPDLRSVAAAPLSLVIERWQGLGYNRRAMWLKRSAEMIVERFGGEVPGDVVSLRELPGVGAATAAAVMNYAWGVPVPFIETNVRAVILHHFFAGASGVPDSQVMPIVSATWDLEEPRDWGYALMDYGTHLKRTLENPSRRSRHHARQTPFEGSRRQRRARLLRAVLERPGSDTETLASASGEDAAAVHEILEELAEEGFIALEDDLWRIRD